MNGGDGPSFPPLLAGLEVEGGTDPFAKACAEAALGCDAGTVVYNIGADRLAAAIVFAPEVALEDAMAMLPACGVGFQNALGALAPPEVAVHLTWEGGILVNGAACGGLRVAASTADPDAEPEWLVVGLTVPLIPDDPDAPGAAPDRTSLYEEGCVEVEPASPAGELVAPHAGLDQPLVGGGRAAAARRMARPRARHGRGDRAGPAGRAAAWYLRRHRRAFRHAAQAGQGDAPPAAERPSPGMTMNLARAIHFDESDMRVFYAPARTGEWCISGGFEFSNWGEADLAGKARQAFANGWLGIETFGRVTFVAVTRIEADELEALAERLAGHFVEVYGAPSVEAALPAAREELGQMAELCEDHAPNTLLTVARELTDAGVKESYRAIEADDAGLEQFAIHPDGDAMG